MGDLNSDHLNLARVVAARRMAARESLEDFFRYRLWQERRLQYVQWNWHISYICELLEACYRREIRRLIINVPPRHFKTELVQTFIAWMIGRENNPRASTVVSSYAASLAYTTSRKAKELVTAQWFCDVFGTHIVAGDEQTTMVDGWTLEERHDDESRVVLTKSAVKEWETNGRASVVAAGVGGELTGKGGDYLIGDDLLKPLDANSEIVREKTNAWLGETFESRLNDPKRGVIIHIAQRLHEQDPCGYLLEKMRDPNAAQYTHIKIPLVAPKPAIYSVGRFRYVRKAGELLHPERIDERRVAELRAQMQANFDGQYQQEPSKMEGGMLRPGLVQMTRKTPRLLARELGLRPSAFIDLASTEKQTQKDDPDWTVCQIWAKDSVGRYWLLDQVRTRSQMDAAAAAIYELCRSWDIWEAWCERGALLNALYPYLRLLEASRHRRLSVVGVPLPATGDAKVTRAHGFQALLNAGLIWMCSDQPWWPELRSELVGFPRAAHDDQVDCASMMAMLIDSLQTGRPPPQETQEHYHTGEVLYRGEDLQRMRAAAVERQANHSP